MRPYLFIVIFACIVFAPATVAQEERECEYEDYACIHLLEAQLDLIREYRDRMTRDR